MEKLHLINHPAPSSVFVKHNAMFFFWAVIRISVLLLLGFIVVAAEIWMSHSFVLFCCLSRNKCKTSSMASVSTLSAGSWLQMYPWAGY